MDNYYDSRQGKPVSWPPGSPSTPSFSPRVTPSNIGGTNSWKPFSNQSPAAEPSSFNGGVIYGSVNPDAKGGYVHTFGSPKKVHSPQVSHQNSNFGSTPSPLPDSQSAPHFTSTSKVAIQGPKPFTPAYARQDSNRSFSPSTPQDSNWASNRKFQSEPEFENQNPFFAQHQRQNSNPTPQKSYPSGLFQNQPIPRQISMPDQYSPTSPPVRYSTTMTYEPTVPKEEFYDNVNSENSYNPTSYNSPSYSRQASMPSYNSQPLRQDSVSHYQAPGYDSVNNSSYKPTRQESITNPPFIQQPKERLSHQPTRQVCCASMSSDIRSIYFKAFNIFHIDRKKRLIIL